MASGETRAGRVVCASWLAPEVLLALVEGDLGDGQLDVEFSASEYISPAEAHVLPIEKLSLLCVSLPVAQHSLGTWSLAGRGSQPNWKIVAADLRDPTDLKTLLRDYLAPLEAPARNRAVDFLARTAGSKRPHLQTSQVLLDVREALRERLPIHENTPDQRRGAIVEHILRVNDKSVYLKGWMYDQEAEIVRLTAVSPEGGRIELLESLFRQTRPDVVDWSTQLSRERKGAEYGFVSFIELDAPSLPRQSWLLEMENAEGTAVEIPIPSVQEELLPNRATILQDSANRRILEDDLMVGHIMPAISRIQESTKSAIQIDTVVEHGIAPASPDVSIIVPLYMNIEYLEGQLAEFAWDPAISKCDLIYVLDSPEQGDALDYLAGQLAPIYRIPFRVVTLEQNVGFAGANNAGASVARGRLLLLLNSDVLPDQPGWLETMQQFHDSKPNIGALAPKLIYEDDSIQHAGMHFHKPPGSDTWIDSHYFRGLHRTFPGANVPRCVPAVSGACMMIDRELYREFDGLSFQYVQGDYEDFDLCLRLREAGRDNWYVPDAELYHLEGQSYSPSLRGPANRYNQWLHTHVWKERIEYLMGEKEPAPTETELRA